MKEDPIMREVRELREAYAAKHNHDLEAICADLKSREGKDGRKRVFLPPRKPATLKK